MCNFFGIYFTKNFAIVNQRVRDIIKHYNLSPNEFSRKLGFDRSTKIYNIVSDSTGVSTDIIVAIANSFEEINLEWLLLGKGEMIKRNDLDNNLREPFENYNNPKNEMNMDLEFKQKDQLISILLDKIALLEKELSFLKNPGALNKQIS